MIGIAFQAVVNPYFINAGNEWKIFDNDGNVLNSGNTIVVMDFNGYWVEYDIPVIIADISAVSVTESHGVVHACSFLAEEISTDAGCYAAARKLRFIHGAL